MRGAGIGAPESGPREAALTGAQYDLRDRRAYEKWREEKLASYPRSADELRVEVADPARPTPQERAALTTRCRRANMALYALRAGANPAPGPQAEADARGALHNLATAFGLVQLESHRSADEDGIVAIEATEEGGKRGFIPYSRRAMNWHTDGYYNAEGDAIRSMILHCVRPARQGGGNAVLDPEIVYLRLRDINPSLVAALMHPEAMTIPESIEEDGRVRPVSTGPVFWVDPADGNLVMRYTARTRSIAWRNDEDTRAAVAHLERLMGKDEEPLTIKLTMNAGEGLLCNNVLHARTAFEDGDGTGRLLLRARYRQRIAGS